MKFVPLTIKKILETGLRFGWLDWRLEAIFGFRNPESSMSRLPSSGPSASLLIPHWNSKKLLASNNFLWMRIFQWLVVLLPLTRIDSLWMNIIQWCVVLPPLTRNDSPLYIEVISESQTRVDTLMTKERSELLHRISEQLWDERSYLIKCWLWKKVQLKFSSKISKQLRDYWGITGRDEANNQKDLRQYHRFKNSNPWEYWETNIVTSHRFWHYRALLFWTMTIFQ